MSDRASAPVPGPDRPTHGAVANPNGEAAVAQGSFALTGPQLVSSRSLGRLLGLESLMFNVECCLPSGAWLDRSAAAVVEAAADEGRTGLCTVGLDVWTLPLASRCARVGLRFVVLEPSIPDATHGGSGLSESDCARVRTWLSVLGTWTFTVESDLRTLREAAGSAVVRSGLRLVLPDDPLLQTGLAVLVEQLEGGRRADRLLALPGLTGRERGWLAATSPSPAVPLPLSDVPGAPDGRPFAVVGTLEAAGPSADERRPSGAADDDLSSVLDVVVSHREADAARRLLAREEGLLVSRHGGAGLAGLVRALREDRGRRPRERRLKQVTSAIVVLTGDPLRASDEPPPVPDAVSRHPISLESLQDDLARLLVSPPGR